MPTSTPTPTLHPSPSRRFTQVDVFTATPLLGNPLAVVHDAQGLSEAQMQAFARWTNLSETSFLLPPTDAAAAAGANYRLRIFTPHRELPFAGHPTLGSCHAWLAAGGVAQQRSAERANEVVQECAVGLIRIRRDGEQLAFAAPPCRRSGPLDAELVTRIAGALALPLQAIVDHQWVDNGPGWCAIRLASAQAVLDLEPNWAALHGLYLGVVGAHPVGHDAQFEVRSLIGDGAGYEDPVTGSLNAGLAQWLIGSGVAPTAYVAAQGARLGRSGRVFIERVGDDVGADIWVGGHSVSCIAGSVTL